MAKKWIDGTVPRFLLVGVINTLVGCGAMFLLYNLAELLTILPLVLAPPYQPRRLAREPADPAPSDHPDTQEEEAHE